MNLSKCIDSLLFLLHVVFLVSNVFAFRAVTSICLVLLILTGLLKNKIETKSWLNIEWKNPFFITCCFYFFIQTFFLIAAPHTHSAATNISTKTAVVFAPFCLCCCYVNRMFLEKLLHCYVWIVLVFEIICLLIAAYHFFNLQASIEVFFYHALVSPFKQHAVYVSILVFIAFLYLLDSTKRSQYQLNSKAIHVTLILAFLIFVLLLSSKLVITFMVFVGLYYMIFPLQNHSFFTLFSKVISIVVVLIFLGCISLTENPISKRYKEVLFTNIAMVQEKSFTPNTYFDGIQFRLLEWRFVKEILNEKSAWLTGVSTDAQTSLNEKYESTHMYIGDGKSSDKGYLDYNTHNQFLESILQTGIIGLMAFVFICGGLIFLAIKAKNTILVIVIVLLLVYSFNESILERQYGIIIFTFFPLLLYRYSLAIPKQISDET